MAWAMLEIGDLDRAETILTQGVDHPLLPASASLYHGSAGWGMANLKFWLTTGKGTYLDQAVRVAEQIMAAARESAAGPCWPDPDGQVRYGLAHGEAGIGLFFLYLFAATGQSKWKNLAVKALDYDLAQAVAQSGGGFSWRKGSAAGANIVYSYWEHGQRRRGHRLSAFCRGPVQCSLSRSLAAHLPQLRQKVRRLSRPEHGPDRHVRVPVRRLSVHQGGAFSREARRLADGIALFAIRDANGVAFPCNGARISCDFAMGTAGIMLTLDRLVSGRRGDFLLDELLNRVS